MLDWVLECENATLGLGLIAYVRILLPHAHHHTCSSKPLLMSGGAAIQLGMAKGDTVPSIIIPKFSGACKGNFKSPASHLQATQGLPLWTSSMLQAEAGWL